MAYIIAEPCVDVKDESCIEVCPVDCIYTDAEDRISYIHPVECIDCGACEPACPVSAIFLAEETPSEFSAFIELNTLWFSDKPAARAKVSELAT